MTKKLEKLDKADIAYLKNLGNKDLMPDLLSPLEAQIVKHGAQPFTYKFKDISIYISASGCRQFILNLNYKIQIIGRLLDEENRFGDLPKRLRNQLDDPTIIASLYPVLRNRLHSAECYTLAIIASKGRDYFVNELGFSKSVMKTLDGLFAERKAGHLFI